MDFDLTPEQKKLFNKMAAAYKACEKAGILFVNNYGTLEAYDKAIVEDYVDEQTHSGKTDNVVSNHDSYCANTMKTAVSWADDEHLIVLTPKGVELLKAEQQDSDEPDETPYERSGRGQGYW